MLVFVSFQREVAHLSFDDTRIASDTSRGQDFLCYFAKHLFMHPWQESSGSPLKGRDGTLYDADGVDE